MVCTLYLLCYHCSADGRLAHLGVIFVLLLGDCLHNISSYQYSSVVPSHLPHPLCYNVCVYLIVVLNTLLHTLLGVCFCTIGGLNTIHY